MFVSYVRPDKARVARLVETLRAEGFEVWWDDDILPDQPWEATIERALAEAGAVVVCWSAGAVASENVRSEARWARTNGRLVQIFLDKSAPPLFFGERQGIDLSGWNGRPGATEIARLSAKLREMVAGGAAPNAAPAPAPRPVDRTPPRRRRLAWAAAGLLALVAVGSGWFLAERQAVAVPTRGTRIAVLPFENLSEGNGSRQFASALTDQIVTALNQSEMPTLSHADVAPLRGADNTARLRELGVGLVFDGSVHSDGKTIDVQVHINDPLHHVAIWSGRDQASVAEANALRGRVAQTVVGVLACSNRALKPNGLTDPLLLGRYLRACDLFVNHDADDATSTFELLDNLRTVTTQAPNFVAAHTDLAKFDAYFAPLALPEQATAMRAEAAREAARGLELDPNSPDAYLAQQMLLPPSEWAKREALLRKGIAIDPKWPHTNGFLAFLLADTGRMAEAKVYAAHAAAADLQIDWQGPSATVECDAGDATNVIDNLKSRLQAEPGDADLISTLDFCLVNAGRTRESIALKPLAAYSPGSPVTMASLSDAARSAMLTKSKADIAEVRRQGLIVGSDTGSLPKLRIAIRALAAVGLVDDAFTVAQHYRPGYPTTVRVEFMFGPRTASMRRDPRFMQLMKLYGLAPFWQSSGKWPDFCADPTLPYNCRTEARRG